MYGIEKRIKVFNCYVKRLAQIESDCMLSVGFMLLINSIS